MKLYKAFLPLLAGALMLGMQASASADMGVEHKVVIQVSDPDPKMQAIALNNAVNLQKSFGIDNVTIEIVAYGPGLALLTAANDQSERVKSLSLQEITFSACGNTMKKVAKKTGKTPVLTQGVGVVPGGVVRIMELQEAGYSYIRP